MFSSYVCLCTTSANVKYCCDVGSNQIKWKALWRIKPTKNPKNPNQQTKKWTTNPHRSTRTGKYLAEIVWKLNHDNIFKYRSNSSLQKNSQVTEMMKSIITAKRLSRFLHPKQNILQCVTRVTWQTCCQWNSLWWTEVTDDLRKAFTVLIKWTINWKINPQKCKTMPTGKR